jgi:hypothetical protein
MNLLISFHSIFQDEETSGWEEEVEDAGREEDLEVAGREESSDGGQEDSKEVDSEEAEEGEEGHEEGAGLDDEGVGVTRVCFRIRIHTLI